MKKFTAELAKAADFKIKFDHEVHPSTSSGRGKGTKEKRHEARGIRHKGYAVEAGQAERNLKFKVKNVKLRNPPAADGFIY